MIINLGVLEFGGLGLSYKVRFYSVVRLLYCGYREFKKFFWMRIVGEFDIR